MTEKNKKSKINKISEIVNEFTDPESVKPWDMLNKENYTNEEVSKERLSICKACPELIKLTTQCKKCGCFMHAKTKLEKATCPLGKW
jgi:hypothetical protein